MSSTDDGLSRNLSQPPPAPPLPLLSRIIAPLSFARNQPTTSNQHERATTSSSRAETSDRLSRFSQTVSHRTGIPISAVDINDQKTHAIIAGKDILRTIKVANGKATEAFNLRSALNSYASTQQFSSSDLHKRREFWQARAVRWSHGPYAHVVATAANNGRLALYDVSMGSARVELALIYKHTGQVNSIDFDPHRGSMLLSGSQDKSCQIWDIRNPRAPAAWQSYGVNTSVRAVKWSPSDAYEVALCTESGQIMKWDIRFNDKPQLMINAHSQACYAIDWHPDGKHLISGGYDHSLRVWDFKNDNRRQKPLMQVTTPGRIVNLAWRPPCWYGESAESGSWQTTQVVTSYDHIDPRTHVWDLRRPMLPFRELDRFDKQPQGLLWATKDLLWTVNSTGTFSQTDVRHATLVQDHFAPCASTWFADNKLATFVEARNQSEPAYESELSAAFLNIPTARLSGSDDVPLSRSLTDDEGPELGISAFSRKTRQATSAKAAVSQANTPPANEPAPVGLLNSSIFRRDSSFVNTQFGTVTDVQGLSLSKDRVSLLADAYSRPKTQIELSSQPERILSYVNAAFERNAVVCDLLMLHQTAQTWRILQRVIVGEMRAVSEENRILRLRSIAQRKLQSEEASKFVAPSVASPFTRIMRPGTNGRSPARSDRTKSSLFRGLVGSEVVSHESELASTATTPLARPASRTPLASAKKEQSTWFTLNDAIEPIQPLPPSIIASATDVSIGTLSTLNSPSLDAAHTNLWSPLTESHQIKSPIRSATRVSTKGSVTSERTASEFGPYSARNELTPDKRSQFTINGPNESVKALHSANGSVDHARNELLSAESLESHPYIFEDFRVASDNSSVHNLPFPLSASKLVRAIIAQDLVESRAGCQLSAHLLAVMHIFFFNSSTLNDRPSPDENLPSQSEQNRDPQITPRVIETIFTTYISFLKRLRLYVAAAEIKKVATNLKYTRIAKTFAQQTSRAKDDTLNIDKYELATSCSECHSRLPVSILGQACQSCSAKPAQKCPICEKQFPSAKHTTNSDLSPSSRFPSSLALATFCHKCGHTAHLSCMQGWLATDLSHGECPTPGCGCACSIGPRRDDEIASRNALREQTVSIRQSSSASSLVAKRDSLKATKSPAVDRARHNLRAASQGAGRRGVRIEEPEFVY